MLTLQDKCTLYISEIITGKRKDAFSTILKGLLLVLSWCFRGIICCRNWAYDSGIFKSYAPAVPLTISIGNIVAGGTGKTPLTQLLATSLHNYGKVAILSRGYKSSAEKNSAPTLVSTGNGPITTPQQCGDEPYLLARNLPDTIVISGRNRTQAAELAFQLGANIILLDDGMQHRQIRRDLDLVVMNAQDPFGKGYFLPRGFLRDSPSSLKRAQLIVLNHIRDKEHYTTLQKTLSFYTAAPVVGMQMQADKAVNAAEQTVGLSGRHVGIFCGIGQPELFQESVRKLGAHVVAQRILADHATMTESELAQFAKECRAQHADLLLCTEKDFVKFTKTENLVLPLAWLQAKLSIVEGKEHWDNFITYARNGVHPPANSTKLPL